MAAEQTMAKHELSLFSRAMRRITRLVLVVGIGLLVAPIVTLGFCAVLDFSRGHAHFWRLTDGSWAPRAYTLLQLLAVHVAGIAMTVIGAASQAVGERRKYAIAAGGLVAGCVWSLWLFMGFLGLIDD
jgi:hypothetical protein